jgi:hypothetical protein
MVTPNSPINRNANLRRIDMIFRSRKSPIRNQVRNLKIRLTSTPNRLKKTRMEQGSQQAKTHAYEMYAIWELHAYEMAY